MAWEGWTSQWWECNLLGNYTTSGYTITLLPNKHDYHLGEPQLAGEGQPECRTHHTDGELQLLSF